MLERQREGIAKAKALGRYKGPSADRSQAGCRGSPAQAGGRQALRNCQQAGDRPGEHLSRAGRSYRREWTLGPDAVKATYARSSLFDQRKGLMEHRAKHFGVVSRERL
jgi:hypothetical protein